MINVSFSKMKLNFDHADVHEIPIFQCLLPGLTILPGRINDDVDSTVFILGILVLFRKCA